MKKRVKLEFFDRSGAKHSLAIEGEFSVEKVNRLLEYAEIVAGPNQHIPSIEERESKMDRLTDVINTRLADRSFDSREIYQSYREVWGESFTLWSHFDLSISACGPRYVGENRVGCSLVL